MDKPSTFRDLIDLWPSRAEFARDLGHLGVSLARVQKWAQTGSVRAEFFQHILDSAKRRGIPITADDLCRIAAAQKDAA